MSLKSPSASDFSEPIWTRDWVIGESESLMRLTRASLVTFSPLSLPTLVAFGVFLSFQFGVMLSGDESPSSYGKPLSSDSASDFPPLYGSLAGAEAVSSGILWIIIETVTL